MPRKKLDIPMAAVFIVLFLIFAAFVAFERFGILLPKSAPAMEDLPKSYLNQIAAAENREPESLILYDESETSQRYREQMIFILESMNVGYEQYLIEETDSVFPELENYRTVIISSHQLDRLMDRGYLDAILQWVDQGGGLMTLIPSAHSRAMDAYKDEFGIATMEMGGVTVDKFEILTDFMIGAQGFEYDLDGFSTYAMDVAMDVHVAEGPIVHVVQTETDTPIVWEIEHGDGRIVVNNVDMSEKTTRGMLAAEYSLLHDVFAYPVINSSVYFIDDFPAPFPEGEHEAISRFYNMDIRSFFATVWLPDILRISKNYQVPFTNVIIGTYKNDTKPPFQESVDKETFTYYGNLMLAAGGEIGYHGYNHQPLVLEDFVYTENLGYKAWDSVEDMMGAMQTLQETTKWLFPQETASVYVPPSNILSEEARKAMPETLKEIKTFAGLYVVTGNEYEQEFQVAPDGMVEFPRIVSGLDLSMYDRWLAMNELNFHFVNSHFFHPDDLLDEKRGADKGWEYLKGKYEEYLTWLQDSAPGLRNQKASDGAKAVQRYQAAEVTRIQEEHNYKITINHFYDELYFLVRIRGKQAEKVTGGVLTPLAGELYLLEAEAPEVTIQLNK